MKQTISPRYQRAIRALMIGPIMREYLDSVMGCSNGSELGAGLGFKKLEIPCERIERFVKNGNPPTWFEAKAAATAQTSGSKPQ